MKLYQVLKRTKEGGGCPDLNEIVSNPEKRWEGERERAGGGEGETALT